MERNYSRSERNRLRSRLSNYQRLELQTLQIPSSLFHSWKRIFFQEKLPTLQSLSAAADDEDRDELVWRKGDGVDWNEVNKAWYAVQRQSRGQIPLDAVRE